VKMGESSQETTENTEVSVEADKVITETEKP
jgi:hypothetical protein